MHRRLPSLDLLRGFEAAARHLSFTRAAEEQFITQSAVSRQIKTLEVHLGVPLFTRMNRALLLTEAGKTLYRTAALMLKLVDSAVNKLQNEPASRMLTVTTTVSFASLWLVPRLAAFRKLHPEIDVRIAANDALLHLERGQIDLAVRFCEPASAPQSALRFAREEVFPVCSPALVRDRKRPLKTPENLKHQVLLHLDDAGARWPWLDWAQWFVAMKVRDLKPAGSLRFSHYDQLIRAAIDGEGVALGRTPLVRRLISAGQLIAPFDSKTVSSRQYFIVPSAASARKPEVKEFADWLLMEAKRDAGAA
jgi:LysR family transcriptional regulator, glycine cleavage system transcriptional activator